MNKKGQTHQVFTYIMVIIVVGAVLILGIRSIGNILGKACEVDEVTFKRDIENILSKYTRSGNTGYETIRVPCNYEEICFLDSDIDNCDGIQNKIINQECEAGTGNNVFISKGGFTEPLFSIENINIDYKNKKFVCIEPTGKHYYIKLEGIGRGKTKISPDEQ